MRALTFKVGMDPLPPHPSQHCLRTYSEIENHKVMISSLREREIMLAPNSLTEFISLFFQDERSSFY